MFDFFVLLNILQLLILSVCNIISMKKLKFDNNLSQNLIKILFFVISFALIINFFPREGKFRYTFQEGKPWRYGLMTAPYDFQIFKSEDEMKKENDSLMKNFRPYMKMDKTVLLDIQNKLDSDYNSYHVSYLPASYFSYIKSHFEKIYQTGVISLQDFEKLSTDSISDVLIVEDNVARQVPVASLYTFRHAYESFFSEKPSWMNLSLLKSFKINNYISENLFIDKVSTERSQKELFKKVSNTAGMIQRGERIIDKGEIISAEAFKILNSLKHVAENRSQASGTSGVLIGQIVLVLGLFILQFLFLVYFRPLTYKRKANVAFIMILITSLVLLTSLAVRIGNNTVYMIPYVILPIMIRTFFDSRTALFAHIITVLICSTIVAYPYEFLLLQITAGMTSVYSLKDLTQRSQLVFCSLLVLLSYWIMYTGVTLIQEGFMNRINWQMYAYMLINGGLLLSSYLLIYLFEWMFGYTSNVTLVELSNINNPLLRSFSEVCPGSFQHSMQVSNLATAGAQEINANVQLARTGAMYHDIGKMINPIYFTENQSGFNPHDNLTFEESANIITSHVTEGLKLAHKHNLPLVIRDCIRSHHGTGPCRYFYNAYKLEYPDKEVPENFFYKGATPSSKETAILMMADAVEASSRSLKEYSESSISELVDRIINTQFYEGSFKDVPITFRDMEKVKAVFKSKLITIYHTRIQYPDVNVPVPPILRE